MVCLHLPFAVIPVFITDPNNITQLVGDNVTLFCSARAVPPPSIVWQKDGVPLPSDDEMVTSNVVGVNMSSSLFLSLLQFSDTAGYSCMASNELVSVQSSTSAIAFLTVNGK